MMVQVRNAEKNPRVFRKTTEKNPPLKKQKKMDHEIFKIFSAFFSKTAEILFKIGDKSFFLIVVFQKNSAKKKL